MPRSPGSFLKKEYDPEYVLDRDPRFIVLVLTTLGKSYTPPPSNARYRLWSPMEQRLYRHPEFRRRYMRTRPVAGADGPWLETLAARVGAERVFEHGNPRKYYLLAVFERNTAAG